uniref:Androgen dependent TFPI regulating protein n=1 Tax=Mus musculus TaxID=10090 RepID=A0A1Y7VMA9_MOUSE
MTKTTTCVYHFLVLNWYIFLNYHIPQIGRNEEKLREFHDGGRSKYLTLLNLLLQAIFFGVACLDDVLKRVIGRKDIKFVTSFRDLLFTTMAFPISTFVFLVFWTLFHYDRSLVYPKGLDDFFPAWVNHAMISTTTSSFTDREAITSSAREPGSSPSTGPLWSIPPYFPFHCLKPSSDHTTIHRRS